MHEVPVNRLGGLSLPTKNVVRLTDRPDMTLDVYRGRKTTMQQRIRCPPCVSRSECGKSECCWYHMVRPPSHSTGDLLNCVNYLLKGGGLCSYLYSYFVYLTSQRAHAVK